MPLLLLLFIVITTDLHAADIGYKHYNLGSEKLLHIEGIIEYGDYSKLIDLIIMNPEYYLNNNTIVINSSGGNILESMKIGNLINNTYKKVVVSNTCISSCFLIYISAINRDIGNGKLGVHRPYYPKEVLAHLSPEESEKEQIAMMSQVRDFLANSSVPQSLIDKIFDTPSTGIYWLNKSDVEVIGYAPSWFDDYINVMCDKEELSGGINKWYNKLLYSEHYDSTNDKKLINKYDHMSGIDADLVSGCRKHISIEESRSYIYNRILPKSLNNTSK